MLGAVRTQVMALRRPGEHGSVYEAPPMPGSPRWIDDPDAVPSSLGGSLRGASSPEAGSLFGSLARHGRSAQMPRQGTKRQRMQKRQREAPSNVQRDIQMLNNIKNLLSPQ